MFMNMPSRRVLKSVAHGLADSFTSRNNDAGGYWAIGLLLEQALLFQQAAFEFDLLTEQASRVFNYPPLHVVPARYRTMLWEQWPDQQWLQTHLAAGQIRVEFDFGYRKIDPAHKERVLYSFTCIVQLKDDLGHTHKRQLSYWCWPHNPAYESKSTRIYVDS